MYKLYRIPQNNITKALFSCKVSVQTVIGKINIDNFYNSQLLRNFDI